MNSHYVYGLGENNAFSGDKVFKTYFSVKFKMHPKVEIIV